MAKSKTCAPAALHPTSPLPACPAPRSASITAELTLFGLEICLFPLLPPGSAHQGTLHLLSRHPQPPLPAAGPSWSGHEFRCNYTRTRLSGSTQSHFLLSRLPAGCFCFPSASAPIIQLGNLWINSRLQAATSSPALPAPRTSACLQVLPCSRLFPKGKPLRQADLLVV